MSAKDIESFFRKISGGRKTSLEKNTAENKPISGDLISPVKVGSIQERLSNFIPPNNVPTQHKLRRAILQVFDPLRIKSDKLDPKVSPLSPTCKILERFNMECIKEESIIGGQEHLEDTTSAVNATSVLNLASSPIPSNLIGETKIADEEESADDTTITDKSSDQTVIEVSSPALKKKYPENLINMNFKENPANAEGLKVSFAATSLISQQNILVEPKLSSQHRYSEDPVRENNILNMQLKVENEIYHEKLEMMNEEYDSTKLAIEAYAKYFNEKMVELTNLRSSYDQMKMHFIKLQEAFSDVYSKYNNITGIIDRFNFNEHQLMQSQVKVQEDVKTYTSMYNELYDNLMKGVNELNSAVWINRKTHKMKMIKQEITLKRLQQREILLQQELARKVRECQEVASLCKNASDSSN